MPIKSNLFVYWKLKEAERGSRIHVTEVVKATNLQRNTIHNLLKGTTTRFDTPVLDALCRYFEVPPGPIPFLVYEPDDE